MELEIYAGNLISPRFTGWIRAKVGRPGHPHGPTLPRGYICRNAITPLATPGVPAGHRVRIDRA